MSFERYFLIEGAGPAIASEALAAGTIKTPYEIVELICRVNALCAETLFERMLGELEPSGKADDYVMAEKLGDTKRSASIMLQTLGEDRVLNILPEIFQKVREDLVGLRLEDMTTDPIEETEPAVLTIARRDFESFFKLDSPGHLLAKEAFRQGVIGTPYEMVETVCAANESIGRRLLDRLRAATEPESVATPQALSGFIATLGNEGFDQVIRELIIEVAEELHVSLTPSRERLYEKYALWSDLPKAQPS